MAVSRRAVALVLLLGLAVTAAQECGDSSVHAKGAAGNGQQDDAGAFVVMENDPSVGIIYMAAGTYRLANSITLNKPIIGDAGAVFQMDPGVVLTLVNQPEHPLTTFFTGSGSVVFLEGCVRAYPEWWGARGDGTGDDAPALAVAYAAISQTGNAMLYLTQTYGLGQELQLPNKATIFSQPSAQLVSVNGNARGLTLLEGGWGFKIVLPHISGFSDFCLRFLGSDLAATQLQTISNCGDGIRMEFQTTGSDDLKAALDNTVWFDSITNAQYAITVRSGSGCGSPTCVFQGNHFVGNVISGGPSSGDSAAFLFSAAPGENPPAWDSNQFDIAIVTPPANNPSYAVFKSNPNSAREIIKIARLDPLAPGATVFGPGQNHQMQISISLGQQLQESQFGLNGLLNLVTVTGATTPLPGTAPVRCVNTQNSKAAFNGGRSLVGNTHDLLVVPDTVWQAGEVKIFYFFHQFATGYLYQIKCSAPAGADGQPSLDCVQYSDNSLGAPGTPATPEEVQLYVINLTGIAIPAGQAMPLTVAVLTLSNPTSTS